MRCNTVTFTAADGHVVSLPFKPLIDRGAVVASRVNGEDIFEVVRARNQLWVPGLPAKFFVRDIVDIRFTEENEPPVIPEFADDGHDYTNRPNVAVKAAFTAHAHEQMRLEGWAHDFDQAIVSVELSFDEGDTWTAYPTEGASAERWVWWRFDFVPRRKGTHKVTVRAVNAAGEKSPTPATHRFEVLPERAYR